MKWSCRDRRREAKHSQNSFCRRAHPGGESKLSSEVERIMSSFMLNIAEERCPGPTVCSDGLVQGGTRDYKRTNSIHQPQFQTRAVQSELPIKLSRSYVGIPAFNQLLQDLGRGKDSSSQPKDFSRRPLLVHCSGSSQRGSLEGPLTTSTGFQDKPLQEYFNERLMELMELGNCGSKWSNRKTAAFAEQPQQPERRSSCSAAGVTGHGQDEPCVPPNQDSPKGIECYCQDKIQNVLKLYKSDCLDVLTMHITAPLEAFVQRK